ncbi:hypothetical protein AUP68_00602 [Ilyonectria robusta]
MNTFNTRRMYNKIVTHINATIPTGASLSSQIRMLSDRIDTLENREDRNDEGGMKKRKALNGNAVAICDANKAPPRRTGAPGPGDDDSSGLHRPRPPYAVVSESRRRRMARALWGKGERTEKVELRRSGCSI